MCASSILFALYLNAARAGPCSGHEEGADAISRHGQRAPVDQQDDQQHTVVRSTSYTIKVEIDVRGDRLERRRGRGRERR